MSLINFRNYKNLELELEPGVILIQGDNGQGKSNLLEAIYVLAIGKSPRASTDRALIRWQATSDETHAQVSAIVQRDGERLRVQIDFLSAPFREDAGGAPGNDAAGPRVGPEGTSLRKSVRINGVPRRASELVGQVKAVMFSADDMEIVYGPPATRRRYLDILISQLDNRYLRALQRYQRVVSQRNHLLRMLRESRSRVDELDFWDEELVSEGGYVMAHRLRTVRELSELAGRIYMDLTGAAEGLGLVYRPSVPLGEDKSDEALGQYLRQALETHRQRELAQGITTIGPHRDDIQLLVEDKDAGAYASRGQSRTAVLALKLAEAQCLEDRGGEEPVLLLDDVLSELDTYRRSHVLERVSRYQQCFITTTDVESVDERFRSRMSRFAVQQGQVTEAGLR